jgi:hypothetical protein
VGATVASGTEVASVAGGKVASAAGGTAVGSGAGAEVGVGGAAAPQAITDNVTITEIMVTIYLSLQVIRHLENILHPVS